MTFEVSIWGAPATVDMQKMVLKEIDLRGTIAYVRDHRAVIRMVQEGKVDLKPFITGRIALEDLVEQGFDTLTNHKDTAVKVLVHRRAEGSRTSGERLPFAGTIGGRRPHVVPPSSFQTLLPARRRNRGELLALAVDLQVAESAEVEPELGGSLHQAQQDALAGTAAHHDARGVSVDLCLREGPDRAAVLAPSDRCDDIEAEHFPQGSCRRVAIKMGYRVVLTTGDVPVLGARVLGSGGSVFAGHRVPPVPPKRSVLIEAAG